MPENVSLLLVGGNHTDTTLVQHLHQTMIDLHEKGVPVVLAVENSKGVDVDRMIRFAAQHAAELQVIAEGPIEGKTVGERVIEKAKEMGVELKDPKPYFPRVLDFNESNFDPRIFPKEIIDRAPTYQAQCELYKFAKEQGITLEGIDRTPEHIKELREKGLNLDGYDALENLEPFRIETMSNNLVDLTERMSNGNGGVILTPDLGAGHVASLKTALDEKVQNPKVSVQAISSQQEGLGTQSIEWAMKSSARSIRDMAGTYEGLEINSKGCLMTEEYLKNLSKQTIINIEGHKIPIIPSNDIHSHLGTLLKDKLTLQQENVRQVDDHQSGTKVEVKDDSNHGFRPGSVGSEIMAKGGVVRTQTGEKERQGHGYY
ncbi:hypothetical protein [Roseimicrobium sp. ORNL1]|uniref:hypothetical protein n=1 Tax=Roseimicrobium sp. ORNL1 TaxID=2711231 RepID=UPI0013E16CBC|nr:hypothetical protein [Roseimicrobium sp. ORNL1]QIF01310.1 hypothetical protein G5S37_07175 [Roseimicrobium sp. ORNL1]